MFDGFTYLLGQISIMLVLAAVVGVAVGRYVVPHRQAVRLPVVPPMSPAEAEASARLSITEERLNKTEHRLEEAGAALAETRRKLGEAHEEVLRMSARAQAMADQKEAEMGRLESGAIAALEKTLAAHREQVASLEERLRSAERDAARHLHDLEAERHRNAQLQALLEERDEQPAALGGGQPGQP